MSKLTTATTLAILLSLLVPSGLVVGSDTSLEHKHHEDQHHQHQQTEHHHPEHQQHEAHVHGVAELTLAVQDNTLELALQSPAANIVGFEHRATTPEQRSVVENAKTQLESRDLFSFTGTSCELEHAEVDVSSLLADDHHHEDHHQEQHPQHGSHNDEHSDHVHNHEKQHTGHDDKRDSHSNITAQYHFTCKQGTDLSSVTVILLDYFPGIQTLDAMWVTASRQGAVKLSTQNKQIFFK